MSVTPKIQLAGLRKAFGANQVLDGVDLSVEPGESLTIIGQSGSGKSVMLKCILGLLRPDAGSIRVDGEEIVGLGQREMARVRAKFGMLFQGGALFDSLPVWRNVTFALTQGNSWRFVLYFAVVWLTATIVLAAIVSVTGIMASVSGGAIPPWIRAHRPKSRAPVSVWMQRLWCTGMCAARRRRNRTEARAKTSMEPMVTP